VIAGAAAAQTHDDRNAAPIGGLIARAIAGGALSQAQAYDAAPTYGRHLRQVSAYDAYYAAAPRCRYRDCDHDRGKPPITATTKIGTNPSDQVLDGTEIPPNKNAA
jgi:hypothetical protein